MIFLVCGSRNWTDKEAIHRQLILHGFDSANDILVEGEARGADKLAAEVAAEMGCIDSQIKRFPAQWDRYGKAAGPYRNTDMLNFLLGQRDYHGEKVRVLAFSKDITTSKGTAHMVRIATAAGIDVGVFSE